MNMIKTIRRNANKKRAKIFSKAVNITTHTLDNNFIAEPFPRHLLEKAYQEFTFTKLWYNVERDTYIIHITNREWIKFETVPRPVDYS